MAADWATWSHPLAELLFKQVRVVQIDHPRVWCGKLDAVRLEHAPCIVLSVREVGEETSTDYVFPLSSILRLWAV